LSDAGLAGRLVFAVDEDPRSALVLTELLRASRCLVVAQPRPEDAMALARSARPFAVVVDVKSRKVDALAALRRLLADPVLADVTMVAVGFDDNRSKARTLGAAAYLLKPVEPAALYAALVGLHPPVSEKDEVSP
jgi:CheY-like chemotaxis protein